MTASRLGGSSAPADGGSRAGLPTVGWARLLRVVAFGGSSLLLAGLTHLMGGGRLPGAALLLVLGAVTGAVAAVVTARRCRLPLLLAVLAVEQVALHTLFTAAGTPGCPAAAAMPAAHGGSLACTPALSSSAVPDADPHALLMLAGHLLATALTAWVLARGEAALWRLAERVVRAAEPLHTPWPAVASRLRALPLLVCLPAAPRPDDAAPRGPPVLSATIS